VLIVTKFAQVFQPYNAPADHNPSRYFGSVSLTRLAVRDFSRELKWPRERQTNVDESRRDQPAERGTFGITAPIW
jgi:hypothetical protein